jgi:hypothetical protein
VLDAAPRAAGVLFDLPPVIEHAADTYLIMDVIHDWDDDQAAALLSAVRKAAPPQARVLAIETILADVPGPDWSKTMDVIMLWIAGGRQRTRSEHEQLLTAILTRSPAMPEHAGPLAELIGSLLAKDPAMRPEARDVTRALARYPSALVAGGTDPVRTAAPALDAVAEAPAPHPAAVEASGPSAEAVSAMSTDTAVRPVLRLGLSHGQTAAPPRNPSAQQEAPGLRPLRRRRRMMMAAGVAVAVVLAAAAVAGSLAHRPSAVSGGAALPSLAWTAAKAPRPADMAAAATRSAFPAPPEASSTGRLSGP